MIIETGDQKTITKTKATTVKLLLGILLLGILFSCDSQRVFEDFYSTGINGWNKDSVATFNVEIDNTNTDFNLLIGSRNMENYPYSNLWLFVEIKSPNSTVLSDTIEYELAHPNGKWIGKGTGGVYFNQFVYKSNVYFPVVGTYKISIEHAMREKELKGIKDIGVRVEKVSK